MEKVIKILKERILDINIYKEDMNDSGVGPEGSYAGVIISGNEAQTIIDSYDRLKAAFERRLFDKELELTGLAYSEKQITAALNHLRLEAGLLPDQQNGGTEG